MLDVGQDQLLVLLLVLQAEDDERLDVLVAGPRRNERMHALVDVGAVGLDVGERRPGDEAALGPGMLLADALVVAVEEDAIGRIERHEAVFEALEDEGLEEPRDMGEMPLGRAGVCHRLHLAVLRGERGGERDAGIAHHGETVR